MSREAVLDALRHVANIHQASVEVQRLLHVAMKAASDNNDPAPVAELQADYLAQRDLAHAAVTFANSCPPGGPDLDGLAGSAFILALFQAATADGVEQELAEFDTAMTAWWPTLAAWSAEDGDPPPRPHNATFERIINAADNWIECLTERENDAMAECLAAQGVEVTRTFTPTASVLQAQFPPVHREKGCTPEPIGTVHRDDPLATHLRRTLLRQPLRVMSHSRDDEVELVSTHWTARSAWRAAHKARLSIEPGSWIELWEATLRGHMLLDVIPWLNPDNVADDGSELVFGVLHRGGKTASGTYINSVGVIGAIKPDSRGWTIMVRDKGTDDFRAPRLRELAYSTWAEANAGVQAVFDRKPEPPVEE
ncbi:hypothetical protein [Mycolicibacterium fortuitum]|uniref:Uncharacterized protein n=1 Tax=Mycolicibacterium fortuitum TaxID=1766 RepID=A0AAE4VCM7_MYCFO|nr:hypothetical protein [Mycolicibacterium fortuitum]MDV7193310.1 hypothetical protein [Mycolicibacterium fortuitum]MDV7206009.1 hypothetical protein [Mycolicibacterium fortuitum]MDV7227422.1 hypothetical protein [Mycolicibacterium fortuitum]MDV7259881.1 hypothetical protein [Mycolicibacterium fortuitum]MDV7286030.1 hypothetical protein [Mycolicibacterium fortuitum]